MAKKSYFAVGMVVVVLIAIMLAVGPFKLEAAAPNSCIKCHALIMKFSPGQYEYVNSFSFRCQSPPTGGGGSTYTGLVIWGTPDGLQLESAVMNQTALGGCPFDSCTASKVYDVLAGVAGGTDNDYSPNALVNRWSFALPDSAGQGYNEVQCSYVYRIKFVNPNPPQPIVQPTGQVTQQNQTQPIYQNYNQTQSVVTTTATTTQSVPKKDFTTWIMVAILSVILIAVAIWWYRK